MRALRRKLRLGVGGILVMTYCLLASANARADYSWGWYGNGYISSGDPINLIFSANAPWWRTHDFVLSTSP